MRQHDQRIHNGREQPTRLTGDAVPDSPHMADRHTGGSAQMPGEVSAGPRYKRAQGAGTSHPGPFASQNNAEKAKPARSRGTTGKSTQNATAARDGHHRPAGHRPLLDPRRVLRDGRAMAPIQISAELIKTRDSLRELWAGTYETRIARLKTAIGDVAQATGKTPLELVLPCAKSAEAEGKPGATWELIAAAVDLTEQA